jgi:hypothetical protein
MIDWICDKTDKYENSEESCELVVVVKVCVLCTSELSLELLKMDILINLLSTINTYIEL